MNNNPSVSNLGDDEGYESVIIEVVEEFERPRSNRLTRSRDNVKKENAEEPKFKNLDGTEMTAKQFC